MKEESGKDLRTVGSETQEKYSGSAGRAAVAKWQKYDPRVASWLVENLFGQVYGNEVLDLRTRCLCTITALIVQGNEGALANHMRSALHLGIKKEELVELIAQMVWYAGMPAATKAVNVLDQLVTEENK
jgi:alkylhydroperoxidase/carboxymuconolactone decarboxylase family protein YurZ